jgi:polyisoprenoid-binding protein YceI
MTKYNIDTTHSEIGFTARHMVFAKVRGQFKTWTGKLEYDANDPTRSKIEAEIEVASIDTREPKRDEHLRSADFFDAEKFPKLSFTSKRIDAAGTGAYRVTGDLTIHGTTREVTLEATVGGTGKDPWGNQRLGFSLEGSINRSDFGLRWNQVLETGGVLVSEKIDINVEVQVVQVADAPAANAGASASA